MVDLDGNVYDLVKVGMVPAIPVVSSALRRMGITALDTSNYLYYSSDSKVLLQLNPNSNDDLSVVPGPTRLKTGRYKR